MLSLFFPFLLVDSNIFNIGIAYHTVGVVYVEFGAQRIGAIVVYTVFFAVEDEFGRG